MRPVLVLLNGAPASGKSTLARAWCEAHGADLPMALDIDVLRSMIGGWRDARIDAGLAARAAALAAALAHLLAGRDVLVPQFLERADFIGELAATAASVGAGFLECAVDLDPDSLAQRHGARAAAALAAGRAPDEGELDAPLPEVHARLSRFLLTRGDAVRLPPDAAEALVRLDEAVARARQG